MLALLAQGLVLGCTFNVICNVSNRETERTVHLGERVKLKFYFSTTYDVRSTKNIKQDTFDENTIRITELLIITKIS